MSDHPRVEAVLEHHRAFPRSDGTHYCSDCGTDYPCETRQLIEWLDASRRAQYTAADLRRVAEAVREAAAEVIERKHGWVDPPATVRALDIAAIIREVVG